MKIVWISTSTKKIKKVVLKLISLHYPMYINYIFHRKNEIDNATNNLIYTHTHTHFLDKLLGQR